MRENRMRAYDRDEPFAADRRNLDASETERLAAAVDWEQQQLLPGASRAVGHSDRPSERLRQAGLVGIAQAREALAEAARRAQARSESRAA